MGFIAKHLKNLDFKYVTIGYMTIIYCILNILITPATGIGVSDLDKNLRLQHTENATTTVIPATAETVDNTRNSVLVTDNLQRDDARSTLGILVEVITTPVTTTEQKGVWCYCNFPQCVPTGYMCQSEAGVGCFSKLSEEALSTGNDRFYRHLAVDSLTRGCVELLTNDERHFCESKRRQITKEQNSERGTPEKVFRNDLQCCHQDMCNYEMSKPIIVREIEESEVTLSPEREWFRGITIGVSVTGIMILIFLLIFAGRILTSEEKGRSSEFLNEHASRDLYIKVPFYIERAPDAVPTGGEVCSILCVKSLQKSFLQRRQQDVADYCRFHPLASNRHSLSCPSSLAIFPPSTEEEREELQPLRSNLGKDQMVFQGTTESPGQVTGHSDEVKGLSEQVTCQSNS